MTLPNFIIVGVAKSGTTSLYHYLGQHPEICMSRVKEPKFFMDVTGNIGSLEEYTSLFSHCENEKAIGEATTWYLFDKDVAHKLKEVIPGIKIIIILRNPAEMAFSQWRHTSRLGKRGEKLPFAEALGMEHKRMSDKEFNNRTDIWPPSFYYFHRALYFEQVKRYMDAFGREKVLVLIFEEFKDDPLAACRTVFGFLGVDTGFEPKISAKNVGREVRHRGFSKFLNNPAGFSAIVSGFLPEGVRAFLNRLNKKSAPRLDEVIRTELLNRYSRDVEKLEALLGRDLSIWRG